MTELKYVPVFRSRQQENIVLKSFDFGDSIYPMLEIVKEYDRKRSPESQSTMEAIYGALIDNISARKVFVDLPVYLKERPSMKSEVLEFSRNVCGNRKRRTEFILSLSDRSDKVIPVISSYLHRNGEGNSLTLQFRDLQDVYGSICFRLLYNHFLYDWDETVSLIRKNDYVILDLDSLPPYPSPQIMKIVGLWRRLDTGFKIVIRSAINSEVQNVLLNHGDIIYDADNSLLRTFGEFFYADAFGDYAGIKKDDMTSGGTISPGFIMYDPIGDQYIGFKGHVKNLSEFESTIVPDVIKSEWVSEMQKCDYGYLDENNEGWKIIGKISRGEESGRSQAKFKRISMEHYLYCIKKKVMHGDIR